jgi:DNA phosphorothioation-dependent restriction protein DptG
MQYNKNYQKDNNYSTPYPIKRKWQDVSKEEEELEDAPSDGSEDLDAQEDQLVDCLERLIKSVDQLSTKISTISQT